LSLIVAVSVYNECFRVLLVLISSLLLLYSWLTCSCRSEIRTRLWSLVVDTTFLFSSYCSSLTFTLSSSALSESIDALVVLSNNCSYSLFLVFTIYILSSNMRMIFFSYWFYPNMFSSSSFFYCRVEFRL
jgi:hypothetical protein